jgi:hypothetical protein
MESHDAKTSLERSHADGDTNYMEWQGLGNLCSRSHVYRLGVPLLRVFASFDIHRDEDLLKRLIADSKEPDSKFMVFDRSSREPPSPEAEERLRQRISKVDAVMVLCGVWTHKSPNVTREIKIAQELGKRYYLVKGRAFLDCSKPTPAHIHDKMFKWARGTVEQLVIRNI